MRTINAFSGKHHFLSNFSSAEVWLDGASYPSVEHAYQAAKTLDESARRRIRDAQTPNLAKRLGRRCTLRPEWEQIKVSIMHDLVRQKFRQHDRLTRQLLDTDDAELIEGNWWGDRFWGMCNGRGENNLGKILMQVRAELVTKLDDLEDEE